MRAEREGDGLGREVSAGLEPRLTLAHQGLVAHCRPRHFAEGQAPLRHAGHVQAPAREHHVGGRTFEHLGGDPPCLVGDFA